MTNASEEMIEPDRAYSKAPIRMVPPIYVRELYEKNGGPVTGKMLGVSDSLIYKALKEDAIRVTYELAAMGIILQEKRNDEPRDMGFIICVPAKSADKWNTLDTVARSFNFKIERIF